MGIKFDVTKIKKEELVDTIKTLNNLIDASTFTKDEKLQKLRYVAVKVEDMVRGFVEAVNLIPEEVDLPENIVNMYQYIANECVTAEEEVKVVAFESKLEGVKIEEIKPPEDVKIPSEKIKEPEKIKVEKRVYSMKDKMIFLEKKIREAKYTSAELIKLYVEKFGGSKSTPNYLLWSGTRVDTNKFSELIIVKAKEPVRFLKEPKELLE